MVIAKDKKALKVTVKRSTDEKLEEWISELEENGIKKTKSQLLEEAFLANYEVNKSFYGLKGKK